MSGKAVCTTAIDLLRGLGDRSVGAIITDPPFHISVGRAENWSQPQGIGADPWNTVSTVDEIIEWTKPHVEQASRVLRLGGALVVMGGTQSLVGWDFCAHRYGFQWMAEIVLLWNSGKPRANNFGSLHSRIVWYCRTGHRSTHTFNSAMRSIYSNVMVAKKIPRQQRKHPSEKPVAITNFLVSLLTREDDLIVDPFCGSGTTLVSATLQERDCIGADFSKDYTAISNYRIARADQEEYEPISLWVNGQLTEM